MNEEKRTLPEFSDPPVIEVALGVQFDELPGLKTSHVGLLWEKFRDQLPRTQDHSPLPPSFEKFDAIPLPQPSVRFEQVDSPPLLRCWFMSEEEDQMIQIQQGRFVHNWRKVGLKEDYPRYGTIRARFFEELKIFEEFLSKESLGKLVPNQCEITYVNVIVTNDYWETHGQVDKVLSILSREYSDSFLPEPETVSISTQFVIKQDDNPIGRLHIKGEPVFRQDDMVPGFQLTLTARGEPAGEGLDKILDFMDIGREWIVRGFTSVTTKMMHDRWGRINNA